MNTQKNYEEEKAKVRQFRCEAKDVIDEMTWKTMDEVQERLKPVMPQAAEAPVERQAAAQPQAAEGALLRF